MNEDTLLTILLNVNDYDLYNLAIVNKNLKKIYDSDYFKNEKLKTQIIPFIKKLKSNAYQYSMSSIKFNRLSYNDLLSILPTYIIKEMNVNNVYMLDFNFYNETDEIDLFIKDGKNINIYVLTENDVFDILMKMFKYNPKTKDILYKV
jgi:hypothetical protein